MKTSDAPVTPDFYDYPWQPLSGADVQGDLVVLRWPDGVELQMHQLWLRENAQPPYGIDASSREGTVDLALLPDGTRPAEIAVEPDGALRIDWQPEDFSSRYHPGWLRHVADGRHGAHDGLPTPVAWTAATMPEPVTFDVTGQPDGPDDATLRSWIVTLLESGLARLRGVPTDLDYLGNLGARIGALRDTNFGTVWSVRAVVEAGDGSTAYSGLRLGPHTDLPTRISPPGFQFLHCVENSVNGGTSRMTDGLAIVEHLRADEPEHYDAAASLPWIFVNRSAHHDHRYSGPLIDWSADGALILRAFYPVRAFPDMAAADQGRAYAAWRRFAELACDPRFQIGYPFVPGDVVGFDNWRMLHSRDQFDPGAGSRHLRGCYIDHDELMSRARVLGRRDNQEGTRP